MRIAFFAIPVLLACGGGGAGGGGGGGGGGNADASGGGGGNPDAPTDPTLRYEPWTVGSTWSYKLTDPKGVIPDRLNAVTTIMPMQDVGGVNAGKLAYFVHIEKIQGWKDVWEAPSGDLDIRYQTKFYDQNSNLTETDTDQPYRLKLDESFAHTMPGARYSETFTETAVKVGSQPSTKSQSEDWNVVSDSEQVTVIAGTFTCLHVQRNNPANPGVQDYWYARGVGKIKETGGAQDEELMSYSIK